MIVSYVLSSINLLLSLIIILYWIIKRRSRSKAYKNYQVNETNYDDDFPRFKPVPPKKIEDLEGIVNFYNYQSLKEVPALLPDYFLTNELRIRLEAKCEKTRGKYYGGFLLKDHLDSKFSSELKASEKEFILASFLEVKKFFENHLLIKYSYETKLDSETTVAIIIKWEGINKKYLIIISCKNSINTYNNAFSIKQTIKGYQELHKQRDLIYIKMQERETPKPFSYFLVLLVDFPIPFKDSIYPFAFKGNVLVLNYKYFKEFLESINEIAAFI